MVDKPLASVAAAGSVTGQVAVFVKQPLPGRVKTRLCPPLTAAEAAAFYAVTQEETIARLAAGPWAMTLVYAGAEDYFRERFPRLPLLRQGEGDLGVRLQRAVAALFGTGGPVVVVGSDAPDLPLGLVTEAFRALSDRDVVAAPAGDGGYVLIGLRRPLPQLFVGIPWSTAEVLACTRLRAAAAGLSWRELPPWEDVDDFSSLLGLLRRSPASASAAFARLRLGHLLPAGI